MATRRVRAEPRVRFPLEYAVPIGRSGRMDGNNLPNRTTSGAPPKGRAARLPFLQELASVVRDWRQERRAVRELLVLGERYLTDMGINRCRTPSLARYNH